MHASCLHLRLPQPRKADRWLPSRQEGPPFFRRSAIFQTSVNKHMSHDGYNNDKSATRHAASIKRTVPWRSATGAIRSVAMNPGEHALIFSFGYLLDVAQRSPSDGSRVYSTRAHARFLTGGPNFLLFREIHGGTVDSSLAGAVCACCQSSSLQMTTVAAPKVTPSSQPGATASYKLHPKHCPP